MRCPKNLSPTNRQQTGKAYEHSLGVGPVQPRVEDAGQGGREGDVHEERVRERGRVRRVRAVRLHHAQRSCMSGTLP